ncbi:hypothetical protein OSTOST_19860 [Ostertagia ostertagi]
MLFECGIIHSICELIAENGSVSSNNSLSSPHRTGSGERKRRLARQNSNSGVVNRGVGYGHGSTRSRWDIERTVEERLAREEHLTWLLNALNAFLYCSSPDFTKKRLPSQYSYISDAVVREIADSAVIVLLEYHLKNDSVFDVSEHMELYQSGIFRPLLETAASMASIPALVPYLVKPHANGAKSIAKELLVPFSDIMFAYTSSWKCQMGSPDVRMAILEASHEYEASLPPDERIRTPVVQSRETHDEVSLTWSTLDSMEERKPTAAEVAVLYRKALKHLQVRSHKFIGDYGKLVIPFTFKKDIRNTNPFSPSLRERTKRIAKELASMPNALPLNASNSIFICVDEGSPRLYYYDQRPVRVRCIFPSTYPYAPPKCAFLTTGAGNVRFNPIFTMMENLSVNTRYLGRTT